MSQPLRSAERFGATRESWQNTDFLGGAIRHSPFADFPAKEPNLGLRDRM
jgi:hypothetical protein